MSDPAINIEVVRRSVAPIFMNTREYDMAIYTDTSSQQIHMGTSSNPNNMSTLTLTDSNIALQRSLFMSNVQIMDTSRNLSNVNIPANLVASGTINVDRLQKASTTLQGIVQLDSSITSTCNLTAPTSAALSNVYTTAITTSNALTTRVAKTGGDTLTGAYTIAAGGSLTTHVLTASNIQASNINFTGALTLNNQPFQSGTQGLSNNSSNIFVVSGSNFGVGTSTPTARLDVVGDINFSGNLTKNGVTFSSGTQSGSSIQGLSNNSSNIFVMAGSNFGIGTSTPQARLHVVGDARIDGDVALNNRSFKFGSVRVSAPSSAITPTIVTNVITSITGLNPSNNGNYDFTLSNGVNAFRFVDSNGAIEATLDNAGRFNASNIMTNNIVRIANDGGLSNVRIDAGSVVTGTLGVANGGTGVTASTGTGSNVLSDAPTFTGIMTAATVNATIFQTAGIQRVANDGGLSNVRISANDVVSGTLGVANGGTGNTTLTSGKVLVGNGTSGVLTPTNLHWDNANGRLGIGSTSPSMSLDVNGAMNVTSNLNLKNGNDNVSITRDQLLMEFNNGSYRHSIKTRHNGSDSTANAFDFYVWQASDNINAVGSKHVMSTTSLGVGIYKNSPAQALDVNGNIATNGVTRIANDGGLSNVKIDAAHIITGIVNNSRLTVASTLTQGIVLLSDSVSSTVVQAASSSAVKSAYDTAVSADTNANSRVLKAGDTMTGALIMSGASAQVLASSNDTASVPGYSWNGDTNTGVFHPRADNVALTAGGTSMLVVSPSNVTIAGDVNTNGLVYEGASAYPYFNGEDQVIGPDGTNLGYVGASPGYTFAWTSIVNSGSMYNSGTNTRVTFNNSGVYHISCNAPITSASGEGYIHCNLYNSNSTLAKTYKQAFSPVGGALFNGTLNIALKVISGQYITLQIFASGGLRVNYANTYYRPYVMVSLMKACN